MKILKSKKIVFAAALIVGSLSAISLSAAPPKNFTIKKNNNGAQNAGQLILNKNYPNTRQTSKSKSVSPIMRRGKSTYKSNELIVRFKSNLTRTFRAQKVSQYRSSVIKRMTIGKNIKYVVVQIKSGESLDQAYARYKSDPNVVSVSYNPIYKKMAIPNDPDFAVQWGLNNTGQTVNGTGGVSDKDMKLNLAWDVVVNGDCSSVIVAVLDEGVDYTHADLTTNMSIINMFDFVDNDSDAFPAHSGESHGTHVAGIIGAEGNNSIGTSGVCWKVKILPIRVLGPNGGDAAAVASGIQHAISNGAKIINLSLGGSSPPPPVLTDAMNAARTAGVVVVISAGNSSSDNDATPVYPCSMPQDNIVCVAAMDQAYGLASFSNTGSTSVDVGAPGTAIFSPVPGRIVLPVANPNVGWIRTGAWAEQSCTIGATATNVIANPALFCSAPGSYANTADDDAIKNFDLSSFTGLKGASVRVNIYYDLEFQIPFTTTNTDLLLFGNTPTAGANPFTSVAAGPITAFFGTTDPFILSGEAGISSNCFVSTCSLGVKLLSVATGTAATGNGVMIQIVDFTAIPAASQARGYFQGTSQAAPHVTGLAALIIARNPNFTYVQTINAIINGGETNVALAGTTTSGRTVSAIGSLRYTNIPTGVSATIP